MVKVVVDGLECEMSVEELQRLILLRGGQGVVVKESRSAPVPDAKVKRVVVVQKAGAPVVLGNMRNHAWSAAEDEYLRSVLRGVGRAQLPKRAIGRAAKALHRTRSGVARRLWYLRREMGLNFPDTPLVRYRRSRLASAPVVAPQKNIFWSDEDVRRLGELFAQGYTCPQIAKELGRSPKAVNIKVTKLRRDEPGKYMLRRRPNGSALVKASGAPVAEVRGKIFAAGDERPRFEALSKENEELFYAFLRRMASTKGSMTLKSEGYFFGLMTVSAWHEFLSRFEAVAGRVAAYLGVPNEFFVRVNGTVKYLKYGAGA